MNFSNRYLTYFTSDENRIDIYNSWFGTETIYYNGEVVSKKNSIFGKIHQFEITEFNLPKKYSVKIGFKFPFRIGFDIFIDGKAILLS